MIVDHEGTDAFLSCADIGVPNEFGTEAEAIAYCKTFTATSLVVKAVSKVSEVTKYRVTKLP